MFFALSKDKASKPKELPGGKKKKEVEKRLVITKGSRGSRKMLTYVTGFETFDIQPKDAAKKFSKKFAGGCAAKPPAAGGLHHVVQYFILYYPLYEDTHHYIVYIG